LKPSFSRYQPNQLDDVALVVDDEDGLHPRSNTSAHAGAAEPV